MAVLRVAFEYLNLIASIKVELCASSFPCDYVRVKIGNALPTKLFRPVLCGDGFIEMITGSGFFTCSLPEEVLLTISAHAARCHLVLTGPVSFVRHYSYKDIKKATGSFCRIIYSDAHGAAYRANFDDAGLALVKEVKEFDQSNEVFYREVQLLGRLHHRHLLALRGFCMGQKSLLVFDNVENGSLKDHLNDPLRTPLNWRTRLQIANGVAAALEYLLLFNDPPVYHVSVNSSNVMLDENFIAKLSDVGFLGYSGNHTGTTHPKDCIEAESRNIIFQLGMLMLELITGQSSEGGGANLIQWVQEYHLGSSIYKLIDPDLGNDYDSRELRNLLEVARLCIKSRDKPVLSAARLFRYLQKKIDNPVS